jgi:hypothetical protein
LHARVAATHLLVSPPTPIPQPCLLPPQLLFVFVCIMHHHRHDVVMTTTTTTMILYRSREEVLLERVPLGVCVLVFPPPWRCPPVSRAHHMPACLPEEEEEEIVEGGQIRREPALQLLLSINMYIILYVDDDKLYIIDIYRKIASAKAAVGDGLGTAGWGLGVISQAPACSTLGPSCGCSMQ